MLFVLIFLVAIGGLLISLGYLIWKKEKINLIHSYHYTRVANSDKSAYTEKMGKGIILIGIGCALTGLICFITNTFYGWFLFVLFFVWGFVIIGKAQKKYNGGLF